MVKVSTILEVSDEIWSESKSGNLETWKSRKLETRQSGKLKVWTSGELGIWKTGNLGIWESTKSGNLEMDERGPWMSWRKCSHRPERRINISSRNKLRYGVSMNDFWCHSNLNRSLYFKNPLTTPVLLRLQHLHLFNITLITQQCTILLTNAIINATSCNLINWFIFWNLYRWCFYDFHLSMYSRRKEIFNTKQNSHGVVYLVTRINYRIQKNLGRKRIKEASTPGE